MQKSEAHAMGIPTMSEILDRELHHLQSTCARGNLDLLETGCIRDVTPGHRLADGWSTLAFAQHVRQYGGSVTSIDLDVTAAHAVLSAEGLRDEVRLITGDSVETLKALHGRGLSFDLILLDSGTDPYLIFREYQVAVDLVRQPGLIVIDDVKYHEDSYGSTGDMVLPYLETNEIPFRVDRRWGGRGWIDVLLIDVGRGANQENIQDPSTVISEQSLVG
ncbi:O-methyltransferase [Streptomyces goshikiensis]|uniref:O-methyltransferase n=1 Tax=Streptomyces goshikiensis TaxID=1942 RepID=UPI0036B80394